MPDIRETYELPERPPVPYRIWFLTIVVPALALGLWLLLPDSTVTVIILFVAVLAAVFIGVTYVLQDRELEEPPPMHPVPPPSATPVDES
jgi:hypothetical protein